ncbi:MAG: 2-succinyl-5-enolpyruvyl-6-hydroxy-3-cyclohexene-1-carboxylic-acid synthase [Ignavibacteriaceae bacterium]|nr:2-succinyl-5-enolpyruvyl-6-hydroxy-3-cyclohexene-1-carboxylic-acid synthase [Ignavibacteriaceae bacterium]
MKINRSIFLADFIVERLAASGVTDVCISPGSRSTPLVFAFDKNKKIRKHVIVEERVSAFFALGLSLYANRPVALLCTSGTAVAEYYPAIIEAFQSRVRLVIITADRPAYLRNTGENQCINQENIYANHIRGFFDPGLTELTHSHFDKVNSGLQDLFSSQQSDNPGPVHINVQLQKPFEPDHHTDEIDEKLFEKISSIGYSITVNVTKKSPDKVYPEKINPKRPLVIIGRLNPENLLIPPLIDTLSRSNIPIFADVTSQVKYSGIDARNFIYNYDTLLRTEAMKRIINPDLVIHIGGPVNSSVLIEYIRGLDCDKAAINEYGERVNPAIPVSATYRMDPDSIIDLISKFSASDESVNVKPVLTLVDGRFEKMKTEIIGNGGLNEPGIINELIKYLPGKSILFIGNSLPVRDLDNFGTHAKKKLKIFSSRGASGIDGIISTASGVSSGANKRVYLVIGDLSFLYDISSLIFLKDQKIKLTIIVINNDGGAIFGMLPVRRYEKQYLKYFKTSVGLSLRKLLKGFVIPYQSVNTYKAFIPALKKFSKGTGINVIEVKTDSEKSKKLRELIRRQSADDQASIPS